MLRSIGVVLTSYISIGFLVVATDYLLAAIRPGEYAKGQTAPLSYFVISLCTAPLYSVLGGYLCAWLASMKPWAHVLGLAVFGEMMGVVSTVVFWGKQPHWYALALLVLYPAAVLIGASMRVCRRATAVAGR